MGLLPCFPHQGKPCLTHTKFQSPSSLCDLLHPPKYHLLVDLHTFKSTYKTLSWGGKEQKWAYQWRSHHANLNFSHFRCKNECQQHIGVESKIMKLGSFVQFSCLVPEFCSFYVENGLFYEFILPAKVIHQHIGQRRSLVINIGAFEILQYASSRN